MKLRNVLAIDISRLLMPLPVALDLQIQPVFSECKRSPFLMIPALLSALLRYSVVSGETFLEGL